ncbi:PREDICTED: putative F-box protein At1g57580 [Camelina sativa]|uniref:F-box protein At1g57580 n=1 Tax=Camelina sativa TaxID=90675 RepID=A0ABM1QW84_CAMSA|nr:PREDICTED: putative F-box protein At1g57580 [Camelina sativa]
MDRLPWHIVDDTLFRLDLKTLAKMQCTDKSFRSHLSEDSYFKSEYNSRLGSSLFHIPVEGARLVHYLPFVGSTSPRAQETLKLRTQILGSCSGLLLLFGQGLCVANPYTRKFRFLDHSKSNLFPRITESGEAIDWEQTKYIGFAVDQIDRRTQRFKIVCVKGGSLHWLRNDGSILAFNLETEKALLIPIRFPQELRVKTLFAAADNKLTLIWPREEVIYVYSLENILTDPKWVLVRQIRNVMAEAKRLIFWDVVAYNGKVLLLREKNHDFPDGVFHRYDLRANEWGVMGYIPMWCGTNMDFYLYTPSVYSSVIGLDEKLKPCDGYDRISSLSSIMGLVVGISSEKVETQLRKRSVQEEETKVMLNKQRKY